ncbi:uncharacterized protein LOC126378276 [Pectinophora gossypiella]|uniref:uncharacterized protein LOC126378276 n=1 Tax=Pectinophora gossypiella TaxID=13191 RepID=UPI00214F2AF9|nr:uncharacterized protein LOC126378276 [Pectinophora gossypiella]
MSEQSSSGSWGAAHAHAADIIDLDRYMRGGVRPHPRHADIDQQSSERLVVDAGGMGAGMGGGVAAAERGSAAALGAAPGAAPGAPVRKTSASTCSAPRDKRYSHDSGLSDGSYVRRRTHRRMVGENAAMRAHREREREREFTRAATSTNSMRTFRVACERALRDQQEQIARVAQLCERLTMRGCGRGEGGGSVARRSDSGTPDSSDVTSSSHSRSTRDRSRKDKHRTDECKTYKIIMTKLDELGRLFAARARAGAGAAAAGGGAGGTAVGAGGAAPGRRPRATTAPSAPAAPSTRSAGSVSVSDKLVSTETPPHRSHALARPSRRDCSTSRRIQLAAYAVTTECRGTGTPSTPRSNGPPPLRRLYTQAKRLQALHAATTRRRTRSVDCSRATTPPRHTHAHYSSYKLVMWLQQEAECTSLCSRCRGYWRALTTLANQIFCRNEAPP